MVKRVEHVLHNCGAWDCGICEGGLALCIVCGGAEASMPKECPGVAMTEAQAAAVQAGMRDYWEGHWRLPDGRVYNEE